MRREQKILITALWGVAALGMLCLVGSGMLAKHHESTALFDAPAFSLTDQSGTTVSDQSLRGKVWVASLFFTECPGICPMMTSRLRKLQDSLPAGKACLVSFSLDPEHDTPAVMQVYAAKLGTDPAHWHFLTGSKQQMFDLARGLRLGAEAAHENQPIIHSQQALLIDEHGHVRAIYDTNDEQSMKKLAADAAALVAGSELAL